MTPVAWVICLGALDNGLLSCQRGTIFIETRIFFHNLYTRGDQIITRRKMNVAFMYISICTENIYPGIMLSLRRAQFKTILQPDKNEKARRELDGRNLIINVEIIANKLNKDNHMYIQELSLHLSSSFVLFFSFHPHLLLLLRRFFFHSQQLSCCLSYTS